MSDKVLMKPQPPEPPNPAQVYRASLIAFMLSSVTAIFFLYRMLPNWDIYRYIIVGCEVGLVFAFIVFLAKRTELRNKRKSDLINYNANVYKYNQTVAEWQRIQNEAFQRKRNEEAAERARQQRQREQQAAEAAKLAAQRQAAYQAAQTERANLLAAYSRAFDDFLFNIQYKAAVKNITDPAAVHALLVAEFAKLPEFKNPDAGLLRQRADDPRIALVAHLLPPLPLPLRPPN